MKRTCYAFSLALMVSGCSSPSDDKAATSSTSENADLEESEAEKSLRNGMAGNWVIAPDTCESDGVMIFNKSGAWSGEGVDGFWRVNGDRLSITSSEDQGDEDPLTSRIVEMDENSFQTEGDGSSGRTVWRRCPSTVESSAPVGQTSGSSIERKIIWEFTGGYSYPRPGAQFYVEEECKKQSESLEGYSNDGWVIVSSSQAMRAAYTGQCEGRDIIIERSSAQR